MGQVNNEGNHSEWKMLLHFQIRAGVELCLVGFWSTSLPSSATELPEYTKGNESSVTQLSCGEINWSFKLNVSRNTIL